MRWHSPSFPASVELEFEDMTDDFTSSAVREGRLPGHQRHDDRRKKIGNSAPDLRMKSVMRPKNFSWNVTLQFEV